SRSIYKKLSCAPCLNHPTCNDRFDCLRAITPVEVATAVRAVLRERQSELVALPMAASRHAGSTSVENLPSYPPFPGGERGRGRGVSTAGAVDIDDRRNR